MTNEKTHQVDDVRATVEALPSDEIAELRGILSHDCFGELSLCRVTAGRISQHRISRRFLATLDARQVEIDRLKEQLSGVLHSSFCTKCGWGGVPKPCGIISVKAGRAISWQCGNESCGYLVPEPKSATIESLTTKVRVLTEALEKIAKGWREIEAHGGHAHPLSANEARHIATAALADTEEDRT